MVVALALGLGAYVWFVERKREDRPEKPKEKVVSFDKAKASEVVLARASGEEIRLVKQGESWRMTVPQEVPADANEVQTLLGSLESLEADEVVEENAGNLADFGLEPPRFTVAVTVSGGAPVRLAVGAKTPDENGLYARLPDRPRVFTIPAHLEGSLDKKPFDLRDRDLLHVKRDAVSAITVTVPEGSFALGRDDKGEWTFRAPVNTRAGRWAVDGLLGSLEGLRIESVVTESATARELAAQGLEKPARLLTLSLADGGTRTLEIGGATPDKKRYARLAGSPQVVVIPPALADDLAKGMSEYRAKRLLDVATYEVKAIEVVSPAGRRAYERTSTKDKDGVDTYKWKRTAPDAKEIETNAVQDVLFETGGLEVQEFVDSPEDPGAYGLATPAARVSFHHDTEAKGPVWFELGRKDGAVHARRLGDESVLKLDAAKAEAVLKKLLEL